MSKPPAIKDGDWATKPTRLHLLIMNHLWQVGSVPWYLRPWYERTNHKGNPCPRCGQEIQILRGTPDALRLWMCTSPECPWTGANFRRRSLDPR